MGQNMTLTISLQLGFDLSCVGLAQDDILETKESKGVAWFVVSFDSYAFLVQITLWLKLDIFLLLLLWLKAACTSNDEEFHEILDDISGIEIIEKADTNTNGWGKQKKLSSINTVGNVTIENGSNSIENRDQHELVKSHLKD